MVYILALLISIFFAYFAMKVKGNNRILVFLSLCPLFILYAFRGNMGIDYYGYLDIFNKISNTQLKDIFQLSSKLNIEPFFLFINYVTVKLGLNINFVYFICATITFYFMYKANSYYDPKRKFLLLSIVLFYSQIFFSGLDAVRQIVAISIFFYATKYICEKKFLKFLLFVLISYLFHSSVLLLIPLYLFLDRRIFNPWIYILLSISILIFSDSFNPTYILEMISKIIPKYAKYAQRDVSYTNTVRTVYYIHLVTCILISFLQKKNSENRSNILINMYLIFTMFFPVASELLSTKRLLDYFLIGFTLGLPFGIEKLKNYRIGKYTKPILFLYSLLFLYLFITSIISGYQHPEWLHGPFQFMI